MGIKEDMRNCVKGSSLFNKLLRWSYNSPFTMVIATQDGAGAEIWMGKALRKSVPRKTILKGNFPIFTRKKQIQAKIK